MKAQKKLTPYRYFFKILLCIVLYKLFYIVLANIFQSAHYYLFHNNLYKTGSYYFIEIFNYWDSGWYADIVQHGYNTIPHEFNQINIGFFPLYPITWHLVYALTGFNIEISGFILSVTVLVATVITFEQLLIELSYSKEDIKTGIDLLFLFPFSFFLAMNLSECMYFLLSIACFLSILRKQHLLFGLLGALFVLVRPNACLLLLPMYLCFLETEGVFLNFSTINVKKILSKKNISLSLYFIIPVCSLILFFTYLKFLTGDFWAYPHAKAQLWGNSFHILFYKSLYNPGLNGITPLLSDVYSTFSVILMIITLFYYNKMRTSFQVFIWISILIPLFYAGFSNRYLSTIFPIYLICSRWGIIQKNRFVVYSILIGIQIIGFYFWTTGNLVSW
ncbi:MAG: hypothetical protein QM528_07590 [Phycisphaerales bacterium]|nr:hypothetical protein [Phycisphaerales bacterium]